MAARVRRVVLEHELKREYQAFLQAPNRGRRDSSGRPQRDADEIARWAQEHQLPMRRRTTCSSRTSASSASAATDVATCEDVEVMTPHYRGAHAAAKVSAGFTRYQRHGRPAGRSRRRSTSRRPWHGTRAWRRRCSGDLRRARHGRRWRMRFTERQARFLVTVMLHSGVCMDPSVLRLRRHRPRTERRATSSPRLSRAKFATAYDCAHKRRPHLPRPPPRALRRPSASPTAGSGSRPRLARPSSG